MRNLIYLSFLLSFLLQGCWPSSVSFSDTGGQNPCLKLFYMSVLENNAPNAPNAYSNELTEAIKTGVQNNTRLLLTTEENNPQVIIEGTITNYLISPVALQEGDNAAKNRLTISVQFKIFQVCKAEGTGPDLDEEMTLVSTRFIDYNSEEDISSIQNTLLSDINTQIVQDVINKLLSNW